MLWCVIIGHCIHGQGPGSSLSMFFFFSELQVGYCVVAVMVLLEAPTSVIVGRSTIGVITNLIVGDCVVMVAPTPVIVCTMTIVVITTRIVGDCVVVVVALSVIGFLQAITNLKLLVILWCWWWCYWGGLRRRRRNSNVWRFFILCLPTFFLSSWYLSSWY